VNFPRDFPAAAFYFRNMFIWLIALLLVASVATVGYYQGALRAAFSFVGLLLAALLASPVGSLLKSIVPIFGVKNPVLIAFIAPVLAFVIVLVLFKVAAVGVHKKVEAWYKYKGSDTERMLWERMNTRVGIPVGLANGLIYFFAICTLIYSAGYLTVQVATGDEDSWALRLINRLSADVKSTGMDKAVAPFMPKSELYYDGADVVADIFHTPLLQNRLANYPPFLLVGENDQFKPLSDTSFQQEWIKGMTFGSFVNHEKVKPLVENQEVVTNVLGMLGGDFKDLKIYLETGTSPKYDDEKILGRWALNVNASMNAARRKKPTMGSADIRKLRTALGTVFAKSVLIATIDQKAVLKIPSISGSKGTVQGSWKYAAGKYTLGVTEDGKRMELDAEVDGRHLIFTMNGVVLVFENTRV
jgi:hypothetical protein